MVNFGSWDMNKDIDVVVVIFYGMLILWSGYGIVCGDGWMNYFNLGLQVGLVCFLQWTGFRSKQFIANIDWQRKKLRKMSLRSDPNG